MGAFSTSATLLQPQLDELTKFMASMPGNNQRARNSALSSLGWNFKQQAKSAAAGGNAALGWPQLSHATALIKRNPNVALGAKPYPEVSPDRADNSSKKLWGSLSNLLVYSLEKDSGALLVGFQSGSFGKKTVRRWSVSQDQIVWTKTRVTNVITDSTVDIARWLTEGKQFTVTQQMARYFWALGMFVRVGQTINIPARPLIGPVWLKMAPAVPQMFADKFWERMRKYSGETGNAIETIFKAA